MDNEISDRGVKRVYFGDIDDLWCSACGRKTPHIFGFYQGHYLTCLICHPEAKDKILEEKNGKSF